VLLTIMQTAVSGQLPRQARQLLELLPAAVRADLAEQACAMWVAENGSDKLAWLMALLPHYADERAVNALVKAVKAWKSNRKQKANAAIHWMSKVPGIYGLAQVKVLWENRQFSDSIIRNAGLALRQAAVARNLSLEDLLDEMVPDLGLSREGLALDIGPYAYRVRVQPDLSLRVLNPAGKATKSLPKARVGEDPDKRSLAERRFKALRKNLKPLLKQQAGQLKRAMQCGKSWSAARWHKLYMEHPLLSILAQGMA